MSDTAWLIRSGHVLYDEDSPVGVALTEDAARSVAERLHKEGGAGGCPAFVPEVDPLDDTEIRCSGTVPDGMPIERTMQCSITLIRIPVLAD